MNGGEQSNQDPNQEVDIVINNVVGRDELYKNRSSRKIDSQ